MNVVIMKSYRKDKKLMAIIDNNKTIHFGASGYSDFTTHKDEKRKQNYISRRKKNENWSNPATAGFYAKHILWNKTNVQASINDTNSKFQNINISFKKQNIILLRHTGIFYLNLLDEDEAGLSSSYGTGRYDGDSGDAGQWGELFTVIGREAGEDDAITDVTEDAGELMLETG